MAETSDKKATKPPGTEDKPQSSVTDYLQAPRKKRKNYVIAAFEQSFNNELIGAIEGFIKKAFPALAVSRPQSKEELSRQFGRKISLLIMSDQFDNIHTVLDLVKTLKIRRKNEVIPVLFLTRDEKTLIESYHKNLLAYHETDEYINYINATNRSVFAKIKNGIDTKNTRRARRYKISHNGSFFHLNSGKKLSMRLIDLSIHGALIEASEDFLFRESEQLLVSIPTKGYLSLEGGDYLKLSGRVRRVSISGNIAAISFEHMSDQQYTNITNFLTRMVTELWAK